MDMFGSLFFGVVFFMLIGAYARCRIADERKPVLVAERFLVGFGAVAMLFASFVCRGLEILLGTHPSFAEGMKQAKRAADDAEAMSKALRALL